MRAEVVLERRGGGVGADLDGTHVGVPVAGVTQEPNRTSWVTVNGVAAEAVGAVEAAASVADAQALTAACAPRHGDQRVRAQ